MTDTNARIQALPLWQGAITIQPMIGGLSNESFLVIDQEKRCVVRFGRDFPFHHVSREREVMVCRAAAAAGFAPPLLHAEPGTMVSAFIDGRTFDAEDVRGHIREIATLLRRFHGRMPHHVSGPGYIFWVFHVIRDYARILREGGSRMAGRLSTYLSLAEQWETAQIPLPVIFGHHDLLPANLIKADGRLWLIDYEYAGFSTAMFDLAGLASNAGLGDEESALLLGAYFERSPDELMRRSHAAMQCASLLREAMWSMVSELYLDAPGADYVAYTDENLRRLDLALDAYRSRYQKAVS